MPYLAVCLIAILPVAALSAVLVEMPALRLRSVRRPAQVETPIAAAIDGGPSPFATPERLLLAAQVKQDT